MTGSCKTAVVFGGNGFIGKQIVQFLADQGVRIKVITRVPESAYELKPLGNVGQIVATTCDYSDAKALEALVRGADYVVNCIGILFEKGAKRTFERAHVTTPEAIAKACKKENVARLVHISALGVDQNSSKYAQSKLKGEKAVLKAFPQATILRPSVVFGEEDNFFNMFASLARVMPFLPLIGGGHTKFQPVYVCDVAQAAVKALTSHETGKASPLGQIYELGGPEVLSFKEIYTKMFSYTHQPRCLVSLPFGVAKVQASFMALMPTPLLTPDQVESLKSDNVVSEKALGLADLGIEPKGLDLILPTYLEAYRPGGRFADKASA